VSAAQPGRVDRLSDVVRLLHLSVRTVAGRRFWIWPLAALIWPLSQILFLKIGWRAGDVTAVDAQNGMIGIPLLVLGLAFGVQIIAGEIDRRTLEIAYTVPGGAHRVWLYKLGASLILILIAEALLALVTYVFLTDFRPMALYGALQGAIFYMVLAMAFSAMTRSEAAGAMVTGIVLAVNFVMLQRTRMTPFWNPDNYPSADAADVTAWAVQNRIGFVLAILAVTAFGFARAQQRERVLGN
jgi:hypothetical protein